LAEDGTAPETDQLVGRENSSWIDGKIVSLVEDVNGP